MTDTTASINAKRAKGTGLTEALAKRAFDQLGTEYWAIISIKSESRGDDVKGKEHVNFVINDLEIVSPLALEHVQDINNALFRNRKLHDEGPQLPLEGNERTIDDVLAAGAAHRPHPFLPVDAADDNGICDVCGHIQAVGVHSVQDMLDDPDQDNDGEQDDELEDEVDPYSYVHATATEPGVDTHCGLSATSDVTLVINSDDSKVTCPTCNHGDENELDDEEDLEQVALVDADDEPVEEQRHLATVPDPFTA